MYAFLDAYMEAFAHMPPRFYILKIGIISLNDLEDISPFSNFVFGTL